MGNPLVRAAQRLMNDTGTPASLKEIYE